MLWEIFSTDTAGTIFPPLFHSEPRCRCEGPDCYGGSRWWLTCSFAEVPGAAAAAVQDGLNVEPSCWLAAWFEQFKRCGLTRFERCKAIPSALYSAALAIIVTEAPHAGVPQTAVYYGRQSRNSAPHYVGHGRRCIMHVDDSAPQRLHPLATLKHAQRPQASHRANLAGRR